MKANTGACSKGESESRRAPDCRRPSEYDPRLTEASFSVRRYIHIRTPDPSDSSLTGRLSFGLQAFRVSRSHHCPIASGPAHTEGSRCTIKRNTGESAPQSGRHSPEPRTRGSASRSMPVRVSKAIFRRRIRPRVAASKVSSRRLQRTRNRGQGRAW
jgi:hypothetical protein